VKFKAIIKKQVDEHWDVIRDVCGFKNKEVAYAFFLWNGYQRVPLLELQLRPEAGLHTLLALCRQPRRLMQMRIPTTCPSIMFGDAPI